MSLQLNINTFHIDEAKPMKYSLHLDENPVSHENFLSLNFCHLQYIHIYIYIYIYMYVCIEAYTLKYNTKTWGLKKYKTKLA